MSERKPMYGSGPVTDAGEHVHCGHFTGRGWDTGAATHGGREARCCHCGARVEVRYTMRAIPTPGHGSYEARRQAVHDWPDGWKEATP